MTCSRIGNQAYQMKKVVFNFIFFLSMTGISANEKKDYSIYHQRVIAAEIHIASENYSQALQIYEELFENYDFIFLREFQIATQLAVCLKNEEKAVGFLKKAILSGWQMKSIKRNDCLTGLRATQSWKEVKKHYRKLKKQYESNLNTGLRSVVKKMIAKDQWKVLGALFTFTANAQDRYAEKRFTPQSERQLSNFSIILKNYGYPGERLIGNDFWMSTILSHHNSISQKYNAKDTIYPNLKPLLNDALNKGQISPFELALIDDWYFSTKNGDKKLTYGILDAPSQAMLPETNCLRKTVYLRSIEIRNKLVDVQRKTGMDFYLKGNPWVDGKIEVKIQ